MGADFCIDLGLTNCYAKDFFEKKSSALSKNFKKVQLKIIRQKERCFSTEAPMVPSAAEITVKNELVHFGRFSHCDGFCLFVFLCQFEVSLLLSFSKESR